MEVFGIKLAGLNAEVGQKVLLTVILVAILIAIGWAVGRVLRAVNARDQPPRWAFWVRQAERLGLFVIAILGLVSIWLDEPKSLSTALGLVTAGLAFALQKVVTAFAAYFTILSAKNYTVGDRIVMGGVRGDVIAIGFLQTTIMEMGQPASASGADPDVWVRSRQYTGRVVAVSNGKIFEEPIYNYSRDFEYVWESIHLPVEYTADRKRAEEILMKAALDHTLKVSELSEESLSDMQERYFVKLVDMEPKVFYRITDNWLELSLRFVVEEHGIRGVKDRMSRQIVDDLEEAGIGIASATYDIVGMPKLEIAGMSDRADASDDPAPDRDA